MTSARSVKSLADLITAGIVTTQDAATDVAALERVTARYAVAVTPHLADRLAAEPVGGPLRAQFVPDAREGVTRKQECSDPIGDHLKSPVRGIVHRYCNRVLLKITHVCPVYCRFCFRREMVGPQNGDALRDDEVAAALAYIGAHPEIREVIMTGGDPLVLSPRRIGDLTERLSNIPHVTHLRWHSRVPVVDPARITEAMIDALCSTDRRVTIAVHCNHADELSAQSDDALRRLIDAGITLKSQSVLLKGVNDSADALEALVRAFHARAIAPYYIHHGDLAPGTAHFRTSLSAGKALMRELRARLGHLAAPRYMLDVPGALGKVCVESAVSDVDGQAGLYMITARDGSTHAYADVL